ncbi:TetR/AcrR family transcriptional regulator [Streptomyces fractus]|uniref:TetR/AcrR family transcriptional regulator n=1 Tax=Streptomyces fractus TaxID=641806 RepID=UPI003CF1CF22
MSNTAQEHDETNAIVEPKRKKHTSQETLERGRKRREQILEVATELFSKSGYRGTGLAGIAAEVGVTQAGLLHHFGSKEALLEAVIRYRSEQDSPLIAEIIGDGGLGMLDRLYLLAEHNTRRAGLSQLFTVLVAENLAAEQPAHDFFMQRYRDLRDALQRALQTGQLRGEIHEDADLPAVSRRLIASLDGLQTQWLLDPGAIDLVQSYRELGESLRRELQTPADR